jgi:hypothetical protein
MNRQLSPEASQLGEPQAEYIANRLTAKILLGVGIVCGLISLLPLYTTVSKFLSPPSRFLSDSFRQDSIIIGGSIGLFLLLLTVLFFVYHRYHTSLRVVVYSEGFVFNDWRQSLACRWDEVTELYESVTRTFDQTRGWARGPRRYAYTVYLADGRRIKIAGLEGIILLGRKLKAEIPGRVQHQALQVYQAGGTVWFGPKLNLSRQGIGDGKKILPWSEVAEVKVSGEDNSVTIQQGGRRMRWKYVYGPYVANPWVLQAMVNRIHTLNRSSEQSAARQELLHFPPNFPARRGKELKQRRIMGVAAAILLVGILVGGGYVVRQELQSRTSLKIRRGLENICADAGDRVPEVSPYTQTSGLHPVKYVKQTEMGRWGSPLGYSVPAQWHPQELTDTELVACLAPERVEIERCPYTSTNGDVASLVRLQWQATVTLREAQTGKIVAVSDNLMGGAPPECQKSQQFEDGKLTEYVIGTEPEEAIETWLKPYVEIP